MTGVREHASQHDSIADLPLVTELARITDVVAMDADRRSDVEDAVTRQLETAGLGGTYGSLDDPETWDKLSERLVEDGHADVARTVTTLSRRYHRPTPMLTRVRFETDEDVDFVAGQYVGFQYDGIPRAYSLSGSPTREDLEICVRRVPGGRLSPRICDDLSPGDSVTIRGPYGELVLGDHSPRDTVFVATGTGVAPLKSMIDYIFETGRDEYAGEKRDIWLFLGADWDDDLPYREELRELDRTHENFHFVPCLVFEPLLADWDGETEFVQHSLLKHVDPSVVTAGLGKPLEGWLRKRPRSGVDARLDPSTMDVYACGINAMVYGLVRVVEELGVPQTRIEAEGFG
ncbi:MULTISPECIES: FAD-binding oxidoreductase [unclassified Halorhabdus]|uniref:ferredoxin--NADP reductase n=1 Tax=unclassified Halorhabdus TaxID=2621901 RepID=UPI0023DA94CE|nr:MULTISPECIES: FAD-binding oxidoreductase [unclassified Halorhabdus]WEL17615.1 Flavodoxin reductase (ferredoxin-NADPH reductase) family 1 [Halorhabdus sp. SVX81]WEL21496.1 Flavodoxin reductase (ferredoxin-NADPH reductase) family 1 [Halorhabdus sp. BNX81]